MTDLFFSDDGYHGGAFMLAANFGFCRIFKPIAGVSTPPKSPAHWTEPPDIFICKPNSTGARCVVI